MIYIDKYAYISKLKDQDPMYKLVFCLMTLGVCLWANSIIISVLVLLVMGWNVVYRGGLPCAMYLKLLTVPISFLVVGVLTVGINVSDTQNIFLLYIAVFGTHIGVTHSGIQQAAQLFFKAIGAVACLYYLALSTPMADILQTLGRLKIPKVFIELMGLTYRFIFILLETVDRTVTAQKSRLGYSGIFASYSSLASLASTVFIRSYRKSADLYTALESRGYDGELNVLELPYKRQGYQYALPILLNIILITLTLVLRYVNGGNR